MNISVYNFKSITAVINYELKPLNILSGVNSSGKSSFIQLLLLLKETIDLDSSKFQLFLEGDLFKVKEFKDIVHGKDLTKKVKVSFSLDKKDFQKFGELVKRSIYDGFDDYTCHLDVVFEHYQGKPLVSEFFLNYSLPEGVKKDQFIRFQFSKEDTNQFAVESNVNYFGKNVWNPKLDIEKITYSSIFPTSYETYEKAIKPSQKEGEEIVEEIRDTEYPNIESIKSYLKAYFGNLHYLGPLREPPRDEYFQKNSEGKVGPKGEFVAQVLENFKDTLVPVYTANFEEEELVFELREMTLLEGVKYWLCDVFNVATDVLAKQIGEVYSLTLVNSNGLEVSVRHVGFGISQILPIVVEGLIMPLFGTLVLEQPEIHLHPKVQSRLFDFIYSLTLAGKSVIVETHSDHLITRMRRRIAEDNKNAIKDIINLTFIETSDNNLIFRNIELDQFGSFDYFPEDFIEKRDEELKAIVQAQMKKRIGKDLDK